MERDGTPCSFRFVILCVCGMHLHFSPCFSPVAIATQQNRGWVFPLSPGYRELLSVQTMLTTGTLIGACVCVLAIEWMIVLCCFGNLRRVVWLLCMCVYSLVTMFYFPLEDSWEHLLKGGGDPDCVSTNENAVYSLIFSNQPIIQQPIDKKTKMS